MDTPKEIWQPRFKPAGDSAVLVELGDAIDPAINRRVHALAEAINNLTLAEEAASPIGEAVPAYSSVLVQYDPLVMDYTLVVDWIQSLLQQLSAAPLVAPRRVEIPTRYGGECGPDLEFVARSHNLSPAEVIRIHSQAEYTVYLLGFLPGFPYLGGLDERIATPRLEKPRRRVPAGSVGIAGQQTGIYPLESPGGWQLIGRAQVCLFDPLRHPPALLAPGDLLKFVPVE